MDIPLKYKDESISIKEQWKIFCRSLYVNVLKLERQAEKDFVNGRKVGKSFLERKAFVNKLFKCKQEKERIEKSVKDRVFNLDDEDYEIINEKGFEYWFRFYDGYLWSNSYPHIDIKS